MNEGASRRALARDGRDDPPGRGHAAQHRPPDQHSATQETINKLKERLDALDATVVKKREAPVAGSKPKSRLPKSQQPLAFEWLILTLTRSEETREAVWDEIDTANALWRIPPPRMKREREHVVPLPPRCLEILRQLKEDSGDAPLTGLIFPAEKTGRPLCDNTFAKLLLRMGLSDRATAHGFRSSFRDWAAETDQCRKEVAEACIAHKIKDQTVAAYLRTTYLDERTTVLRSWAAHCAVGTREVGHDRALYAGKANPCTGVAENLGRATE